MYKRQVKRLLTDGIYRFLNGGSWTQFFEMDENHAEPRGYLAGRLTPDNMIHLITSRFYYKFNLAWLKGNESAISVSYTHLHYPECLYQNGTYAGSYGLTSYLKENDIYASLYSVVRCV